MRAMLKRKKDRPRSPQRNRRRHRTQTALSVLMSTVSNLCGSPQQSRAELQWTGPKVDSRSTDRICRKPSGGRQQRDARPHLGLGCAESRRMRGGLHAQEGAQTQSHHVVMRIRIPQAGGGSASDDRISEVVVVAYGGGGASMTDHRPAEDRLIAVESALAHLQHDFEQLHSVVLAQRRRWKSSETNWRRWADASTGPRRMICPTRARSVRPTIEQCVWKLCSRVWCPSA